MPKKNDETRRAADFGEEQHDGLKIGNQAPFEADTFIDDTTPYVNLDRLSKALEWLAYGRNWRIDNAPAWLAFEAYALQCESEGKLLSGNALHAIVKRHDYVNVRTGKTTTLNRTVIPLYVRWLLREHPGLKAELRRSFFDVLFPTGEAGADA